MVFIFPLSIVLVISLGTAAWVLYGFPGLLNITRDVTEFCQSIFVRCIEYSAILKVVFLWAGVSLVAVGLAYGIIKGALNLIRAEKAIKRLPLARRGSSIVLIKDGLSKVAFTHGLIHPRIYLSEGLIRSLTGDELKAVFLHELHHKKRLDPLRFFLLTLLKDSFFYIPAVGHLAGFLRTQKEHEADDSAASASKEPLSLARALLKAASFNTAAYAVPVSFTGGTVTDRIRRLLEGGEVRFKLPSMKVLAASVLMTLFLALSLAMPINATVKKEACSTDHCALHLNKLGSDCQIHCKTPKHMVMH